MLMRLKLMAWWTIRSGSFRLRFQLRFSPHPLSQKKKPPHPRGRDTEGVREIQKRKKIGSFSLIERVILSAGAMLIFSVSFLFRMLGLIFTKSSGADVLTKLTKCPKAEKVAYFKICTSLPKWAQVELLIRYVSERHTR